MKGSLTSGLSDSGQSMRAVENDVEALLNRYKKDFPEHAPLEGFQKQRFFAGSS